MPQPTENVTDRGPSGSPSRARVALLRAGLAGGFALAFVFLASRIDPSASRASESAGLTFTLPDGVSTDIPSVFYEVNSSSDLGRSLGELRGRKVRVEIVSGRGGAEPTYRVLDADGRVLADGLRADEVYTVDPDLTIDRMGDYPELDESAATVVGPLMLLDAGRE